MNSSHTPRICISLCERTVAALERAITAAAGLSDLIEVRLDCLEPLDLESSGRPITEILQQIAGTSILTFRPSLEGGERRLDKATRKQFWSNAIFVSSFIDIEVDLAEEFLSSDISSSVPIDWNRTICSQHDFVGGAATLDQIYERIAGTPAAVLKIAVRADDANDCLPVFQVMERARKDGREIIAIAMGTAGVATRILGPSRGGFLTYASLDSDNATAPGQLSVSELTDIYRVEKIDWITSIFGLIGAPVSHSLSPLIHNAAFSATGMNAVYLPFETCDPAKFIRRMIHPRSREMEWPLHGLSVTAPHKVAVMAHLDWIERAAQQIGAVNTIVVEGEELHGYNTDASGFIKPLLEMFGDLAKAHCAVIGTGGGASAALWGLKETGAEITLFARNVARANMIAQRFGVEFLPLEGAAFEAFDVVVNATPLGTRGEFACETPATASQLRGARLVYDLVYNPTETRFLLEAREAGCRTLGGLAMLVGQAAEQFRLWTGAAPPESVMFEAAEKGLKKRDLRSQI